MSTPLLITVAYPVLSLLAALVIGVIARCLKGGGRR